MGALHEGTHETVLGPLAFDGKGDVVGYRYCIYEWHAGRYERRFCPPVPPDGGRVERR